MQMEKNTYAFDQSPETYQPNGCCDFSKIYNPETAIVKYTNLDTNKTERHIVKRTEIVDNDKKTHVFILPPPFSNAS